MLKRICILLFIVGAVAVVAQNTTRRNLTKASVEANDNKIMVCDTIVSPALHDVDINGYDKPLRSRRETFFATNNTQDRILSVAFTIKYYDMSGRQLHQQSRNVKADIPSKETRQISFKSWDAQQSFYYRHSTVPTRTDKATPYDISISVDTIFISPKK